MDSFVEMAALVLPILGCDLFRRRSKPKVKGDQAAVSHSSETPIFSFSTSGATATAQETEEGFVVLAGSTARKTPSGTFPAGYAALRDRYIASGQLLDGPSSDLLLFATDVTFTSPSAAASIVSARSAGGPVEWRIKATGMSYRDWRASRLEATT